MPAARHAAPGRFKAQHGLLGCDGLWGGEPCKLRPAPVEKGARDQRATPARISNGIADGAVAELAEGIITRLPRQRAGREHGLTL